MLQSIVFREADSFLLCSTNQMYNLFGNLNDEATAYQFYQQNGPLQMQAAQAVVVQQGWFTLKNWLLSVAYDLQVRG